MFKVFLATVFSVILPLAAQAIDAGDDAFYLNPDKKSPISCTVQAVQGDQAIITFRSNGSNRTRLVPCSNLIKKADVDLINSTSNGQNLGEG